MLKNVLRSWILSLQDIGMAKTFIATHDPWPEGASMPRTDFCIIGFHSKYHPATHSTTAVSNTKPSWTACRVLRWWMWWIHCMIQTSPQRRAWPDSNQLQPPCLPSVLNMQKPAPGNFGITVFRHATACLKHLKPGTWDVLLAILCAWTPCTPTSLPCSRSWINALLICNAEAKAWTARMTARASTSEPLVARTLIMKESRMRTGPFGLHGSSSFHGVQSTKSQHPLKPSNEVDIQKIKWKIDHSSRYSVKYWCYFGDLH